MRVHFVVSMVVDAIFWSFGKKEIVVELNGSGLLF